MQEVVIKIPKEEYNRILKGRWEGNPLADYIENGVLLPKEHGRFIDADALLKDRHKAIPVIHIIEAPTVLEADRGDVE